MNYQLLIAILIILIFNNGCSIFKNIIYRPDISQGNYYLTANDIAKIHIGLTKQQVNNILGTSRLKDPFGSNTWYYISRRESGHESITQQSITLIFDSNDILTHIDISHPFGDTNSQ